MICFPVSVFLDTNIFLSSKYDFTSTGMLAILEKQIRNEKVKLFTSTIVVNEVKKHIKLDVNILVDKCYKLTSESYKIISKNMVHNSCLSNYYSIENKQELKTRLTNELCEKFDNYIINTNATVLDNNLVNVDDVLNDYFNEKPPFEALENKKYEFPDALIISQLKNMFSKNNSIYIISKDNGFKKAFDNLDGFLLFSSVKEVLDLINRNHDIYNEVIKFINNKEIENLVCKKITEEIFDNVYEVDGREYYGHGIIEGELYNESIIEDVKELTYELSSINDILENSVHLTLDCDALINVYCSYFNEEESIWDSEDHEYIYEARQSVQEIHRPKFECDLEILIEYDEERSILFTVANEILLDLELNEISRLDKTYLD